MNNHNIFAVQFNPTRPFALAQYVNAMFQLSASMSSSASPDDLRTLQAIASNVKTAHEYEVKASLAAAHHKLEEQKTASSNEKTIKELTEQLKAKNDEIKKKDHELAQYNEHFKQRLNEKTRGLVDQLNTTIAENQDLRRLFAKAVENKVKDEVDAKVAREVARQVAEEVNRQTQEKDWLIARLEDQIKEFSHAKEKHIELINSIYKKNEEIKELRRKVSTLTEWKDAYQKKVLEKEDVDPKTFDPAELVAEIDKLDILNTTLKCANEDYREEIRGYECLHGMMDKNWAEMNREKEKMSRQLQEASKRLRHTTEELRVCKKEHEQYRRRAAHNHDFLNREFEKLKGLYHQATSRRDY
ncbi:hypothetical protein CAEBREN_03855 [Caenorhabditis brenneri]|uniref:Uncharacterized protein n=1 Tax=Caenorhabditis brenneri TaxID=135651 RepID=G0M969_CAEBE|nr:hypothetical protein CAEBREN_03855 [Caenorhabditis brenneri]